MAAKRNGLGLNDLPDSLLLIVLSKISLKQAVRSSLVCKRWKFLWTSLPSLKFSSSDFPSASCSCIIDNIFEHHSGSLELFEFSATLSYEIRNKICESIGLAALKDVKEIKIEKNSLNFLFVKFPTSIFLCRSLTSLTVKDFLLRNVPNNFDGFTCLQTLNFENVNLNDKIMEIMLRLCPVLKVLSILNCYGLRRLKICSDNLISLKISSQMDAIIANCPRLVSLVLIKRYGYMVEMEFCLPACLSLSTDTITLVNLIRRHDVSFLSEFPSLEQMCIDYANYSKLPWDNTLIPEISASSSLENLKQVHLNMTRFYDPTPFLDYLLPHAPSMKSLLIFRKNGFHGTKAQRFFNKVLKFQREFKDIKIFLSRDTVKEGRCLNCNLKEFI